MENDKMTSDCEQYIRFAIVPFFMRRNDQTSGQ